MRSPIHVDRAALWRSLALSRFVICLSDQYTSGIGHVLGSLVCILLSIMRLGDGAGSLHHRLQYHARLERERLQIKADDD